MSSPSALALFTVLVSLTLCISQIIAGASHQCYYPGAILQSRDTPCHPNAAASVCCAPEDICLSNGLCWRANINRLHRGSCTDPTFQDLACSQICTGPNDHPFGWADVLECPLSSEWYCGWGNQSRCENGDTFKLPDGYFDDPRKTRHPPKKTITETYAEACVATAAPSVSTRTSNVDVSKSNKSIAASAPPSASTTVVVFKGRASRSGVGREWAMLGATALFIVLGLYVSS